MADVPTMGANAVSDLASKLPGWCQDQNPAALWRGPRGALFQGVQHWQHIGCGLAGAGLGDADNITAIKKGRNYSGLDRGGFLVAHRFDGLS
jgi:hypothetical protein